MTSTFSKELSQDEVRIHLRDHFKTSHEEHPNRWEKLWEKGELLPWDRGLPSPALVDALNDREELKTPSIVNGVRKKALVPGCGRGYDVLLLASHGYDAVGLDISESAIKECKKFADEEAPKYLDNAKDAGSYQFVTGDFFKDDWLETVGADESRFHFIYDYTFLCALPPETRPAWALRQSQLLATVSDSSLVCLEFPTKKPPETGGPPFGLNPEVYIAHLSRPGSKVTYASDGYPDMSSLEQNVDGGADHAKGALSRIAHWQPERSHQVGQGNDWMSIWRHARTSGHGEH